MLKLWNQRCLPAFLRRHGFLGAQSAALSTAVLQEKIPNVKRTLIGEFEEKFGIPWKSTCLPLSPEFAHKVDSNFELRSEINYLWRLKKPEYPDGVNMTCSSESFLDVSSSSLFGTGGYLVRNNGDRVDLSADTFKGKFVLVCCFHVPSVLDAQSVIDVCDELYSIRDDVEVVVAAWMNNLVDADDHKNVFDHFFSAFPRSCLSVPFEDSKLRAQVCKLVTDYTSCKLENFPCLVLNTEGMALPPFERPVIYSYGAARMVIDSYGASAFPFTEEILDDIKAREKQLRKSATLEQLLLINTSSPDVVYKFNPEGGPREEVHISELNNKLVALYLPTRLGELFPHLVKVSEECMEKQLEFEIVVVNPERIDKKFMQKHDVCRQWWCLPLNSYVSARLNRVIPGHNRGDAHGHTYDKLCVVGPARGYIDVKTPTVDMHRQEGVDEYPFTSQARVQARNQRIVSHFREITLESVLSGEDLFRGTDRDDITSATKLSGKKISVYLSFTPYVSDYKEVISSYREMKAKDPDFEVVFVFLKEEKVDRNISAMPWYICLFDEDRLESTRKKLSTYQMRIYDDDEVLVGFGEDGRVCSVKQPRSYLQNMIGPVFTLDDTLYEDVREW